MACWLGKAVGGTLGMPYEGEAGSLDLTFYDPVPEEMLPNDDLDLQVVYAYLIDRLDEPRVDRHVLSAAWRHVGMSPDEYGVCKRNLALGLKPPMTGRYDNWFTAGMGAAIRTEIWACLAPGDPELAAAYAYEDACMDHDGEGIEAARFLAALQSVAFVESDGDRAFDVTLEMIPDTSAVRRAISDTRNWWQQLRDGPRVRQRIMQTHGHENFTNVTHNLAFIALGYCAARDAGGDLGAGICTAVNCGQDTDCTGATLGALMGILDPDCITDRWLAPIGRDLVLSPSIHNVEHPATLDGLTDLVADLRQRLNGRRPNVVDQAQATDHLAIRARMAIVNDAFAHAPRDVAWTDVTLPGLCAVYEGDAPGDLMVRYDVNMTETRDVRIVFNAHEPNRVHLDGNLLFERAAGAMCPAIHRPPDDQFVDVRLAAGAHELVAVIGRDRPGDRVEWFCGIARTDPSPLCGQWLNDVFEMVGG